MQYTEDDVIWKRTDPRIRLHMKCKAGLNPYDAIRTANDPKFMIGELVRVNEKGTVPFYVRFSNKSRTVTDSVPCIICVEEPEKQLVPFDFSLQEDIEAIKGKWLRRKEGGDEFLVIGFSAGCAMFAEEVVLNWGKGTSRSFGDGDALFEQFVFADGPNKGKPVGKEVEV